MLAKEEMVERLMVEKEEMASKLGIAEHQAAILQARPRAPGEGGSRAEEEEEEGGEQLRMSGELQRKNNECESLRAQ